MSNAPYTGRWFPVPEIVFAIAAKTSAHTVLVWMSMLNDAMKNGGWITTRKIEAIMAETSLTKPTVVKAQAALIQEGLIQKISGGGETRRKITFTLTPIAAFAGKPVLSDKKDSKPVEEWEL